MPLGRKTTSTGADSAKPETWPMVFQLKHWRKGPHDNTSNKGYGIKDVTIAIFPSKYTTQKMHQTTVGTSCQANIFVLYLHIELMSILT